MKRTAKRRRRRDARRLHRPQVHLVAPRPRVVLRDVTRSTAGATSHLRRRVALGRDLERPASGSGSSSVAATTTTTPRCLGRSSPRKRAGRREALRDAWSPATRTRRASRRAATAPRGCLFGAGQLVSHAWADNAPSTRRGQRVECPTCRQASWVPQEDIEGYRVRECKDT